MAYGRVEAQDGLAWGRCGRDEAAQEYSVCSCEKMFPYEANFGARPDEHGDKHFCPIIVWEKRRLVSLANPRM